MGEWRLGSTARSSPSGTRLCRMLAEQRWDVIPGAEPVPDFTRRVHAVITQIAAAYVERGSRFFTHAGVIGEALAQASGAEPSPSIGPKNASISQMFVGSRQVSRPGDYTMPRIEPSSQRLLQRAASRGSVREPSPTLGRWGGLG